MPVYQAVTAEVGKQLGMETELVVETSYDSCLEDKNDVCFVCSLPYIYFERQGKAPATPIAAPVLIGKRYQDKPIYFSDVIVSKNSKLRSFKDFKGHSWAYNEPLSHSGYGVVRYELVKMGQTHGFFSKVIEAGYHETAIEMVAKKQVEGAAIDSQVLEVALRDDPKLKKSIKIIDTLGPSTIQPVAVSKRLPMSLRKQIQQVLINLHRNPQVKKELAKGLVKKFVAADDKSYDDIRMMLEACEKANFLTLK